MLKIRFDNLIIALSQALDLLTPRTRYHHSRVALIAIRFGESLGLRKTDLSKLFYAALLHDIGVTSSRDKLMMMDYLYTGGEAHTTYGQTILKESPFFADIANLVYHHHDRWLGPNKSGVIKRNIPWLSQIIGLADRLEVLLSNDQYILAQQDFVLKKISEYSGTWFNPELTAVLKHVSRTESFWLDLTNCHLDKILRECSPATSGKKDYLSLDDVIKVASVFTTVTDGKSHYTNTHSYDVHALTVKIAMAFNFSSEDLKKIKIASLLHDLGKLSIPDEILEKVGVLTKEEYDIIKRHPYYTYQTLKLIDGFEEIARWSALHHERLNGTGYPFKLKGEEIPLAARIIAVSDIFTALNEDRPYRKRLSPDQAFKLLQLEIKHGLIDKEVVRVLKEIISAG
ncbi:MAG: HD domain-containing phosphohydrolase [Planctomycetota bacterium]